jgi:gamma-glutamyltranspeptidase / glutathione hydrolase
MRLTALALLCAAAPVLAQVEAPAQPEATTALAERTSVLARDFMVAAAHPLAAQAGHDVLAAGGSAADAAVAVQVMLNLVEPQSSGLGGGGFLLYWDAALERLTSFDARERAPLEATPDYWLGPDGQPLDFWDAVIGGRSAGVPGTPRLLEVLHQRHGRLPWAELIRPAIELAEAGFPVSPRLAAAIAEARDLDRFPRPARSSSTPPARRSPRAPRSATPTSPAPCGSTPPTAPSRSTPAPSPATSCAPCAPRPTPASSPSGTSPPTR